MATSFELNARVVFDVSKYGDVDIDISKLSAAQIHGAITKGLHEFLKDAHAGKEGDDARKAVEAKLARLYEGAVPGLGHGGGGKRLDAMERACREEAEAMFRPKMKAELARKAAMEWKQTLMDAARRQYPGDDESQWRAAYERAVGVVEGRAKAKLEAAKGLPSLDLDI